MGAKNTVQFSEADLDSLIVSVEGAIKLAKNFPRKKKKMVPILPPLQLLPTPIPPLVTLPLPLPLVLLLKMQPLLMMAQLPQQPLMVALLALPPKVLPLVKLVPPVKVQSRKKLSLVEKMLRCLMKN